MSDLRLNAPEQQLKRQVEYFFRSSARSRLEVARFLHHVEALGQVAIIGGMLRNLCLEGNRNFVSDIDFVIDCASIPEFERAVAKFGGVRNRFGGFGISLDRWKVDIWHLERTWAAAEGHVRVENFDDLLKATFFTWDEVVYRFDQKKVLTAPNYFEWLRSRLLDINLEPNPNPLGNAVRALRYAWRWRAKFGRRLAMHVTRQLADEGWNAFLASEASSFSHRILDSLDQDAISARLEEYDKLHISEALDLSLQREQPPLPFF